MVRMRGFGVALAALLVLGSVSVAEDHGPVVARATGGYHFIIPETDVFGVEIGNRYALNARRYADGTVDGVFEYRQSIDGETGRIHVSVTCMQIYDGNRAKIGGLVEISTFSNRPPGTYAWFSVRDNGEGSNATADWSTLIGFGTEAANEAFCNSPALPRFGPWDIQGNVQVEE